MRKTVLLVALLFLGALAWLALRGSVDSVKSVAPPAPTPVPPSTLVHPVDVPAEERAADAPHVELPVTPEEPSANPRSGASAEELELHGTIVAIDEEGVAHARENGEFELVAWQSNHGKSQSVEIHEGIWSARVPRGVRLGCNEAVLGGRSAVAEEEVAGRELRLPIPDDGQVELRVRWFRPLRLFVRDRVTNVDLTEVTVVQADGWPRSDYRHPGEISAEQILVDSGSSPIEIAAQTERYLPVHVRSPGRAWEVVELDAAEGGDRIVVLGPGGDLDLELDARRIDPGAVVRVRDPIGDVVAELDVLNGDRFVLQGLPTGTLGVSAEIGHPWESPIVLGKSEVEIQTGKRVHLVLPLGTAPTDSSVVMAGEVMIPRAWELQRFLLVVKLLDPPLGGRKADRRLGSDEMRLDTEREGVWQWRLEGQQAGRYEIGVFQLNYSVSLRVPDTGREDIVLEISPPVQALVHVIDKEGHLEAPVEIVLWNCRRPEWSHGGRCDRAEWDEQAHGWRLRAPRGEIELHTDGGEYRPVAKLVELRDGPNELTLEVQRQYGVLLRLEHEGTAIPWPLGVRVESQPREGGSGQRSVGSGSAPLFLAFDRPGAWIMSVSEIPGYEPIPPFEVTVDPEHRSEHTIELVPKR
jgi:hypothetical protein